MQIHSENSFEVRESEITNAGNGLFAKVDIMYGETVGYYSGEVITEDDLEDGVCEGSAYLLWVTNDHIIVGEGPKSNYTRYINHGEEPNTRLITSNRWKTARFEAIREIKSGEEILFNYGDFEW